MTKLNMQKILTIGFILFIQTLYGQPKFQFEKIAVNEILEIEKANNGVIKDTVEFGVSLNNFLTGNIIKTKTYIYKRVDDDFFPKLHVWYHLDSMRNQLVAITYNWDFYNPSFDPDENVELLIAANKRENEYQEKYKELNDLLKEIFGVPIKVNLHDSDYSFSEMTYWENSEIYVYSRIRFQRKISKDPMIGYAGNHFVVEMVIAFK